MDIKPSLQIKDHMQVIKQMMFTMVNVPDQRRESLGPQNSLQKSRLGCQWRESELTEPGEKENILKIASGAKPEPGTHAKRV